MDAGAAFVVIGQPGVELHPGGTVLLDIAEFHPLAHIAQVAAGESLQGFQLWCIVEQPKVEGKMIHAPVDEGTSTCKFRVHCPRTVWIVFYECSAREVIVMDVINRSKFFTVDDVFYEIEFARQPGVAARCLQNQLVRRSFNRFKNLPDAFRRLRHGFFEQDVFASGEGSIKLFCMQVGRRGDNHRVHGWVREDIAVVQSPFFDAELLRSGTCGGFTGTVHPENGGADILLEAAHQHLPIHPRADDTEIMRLHESLNPFNYPTGWTISLNERRGRMRGVSFGYPMGNIAIGRCPESAWMISATACSLKAPTQTDPNPSAEAASMA